MTSSSFAPELNYDARKPRFNADPATLFEDGVVPDGWQTTESGDAKGPGAGTGMASVPVPAPSPKQPLA